MENAVDREINAANLPRVGLRLNASKSEPLLNMRSCAPLSPLHEFEIGFSRFGKLENVRNRRALADCKLFGGSVKSLADDLVAPRHCKCERLLVTRSTEIFPTLLRFVIPCFRRAVGRGQEELK